MKRLRRLGKLMIFRFKWIFMSSQARYAYLWAKTRELANADYVMQKVLIDTDN